MLALLAWSFEIGERIGVRSSALHGTRKSTPTGSPPKGARHATRRAAGEDMKPLEDPCFQPFNLNRLRAHLRNQRRAGKIPSAISSREISSMDRSEAIAACLEFGALPS